MCDESDYMASDGNDEYALGNLKLPQTVGIPPPLLEYLTARSISGLTEELRFPWGANTLITDQGIKYMIEDD